MMGAIATWLLGTTVGRAVIGAAAGAACLAAAYSAGASAQARADKVETLNATIAALQRDVAIGRAAEASARSDAAALQQQATQLKEKVDAIKAETRSPPGGTVPRGGCTLDAGRARKLRDIR